MEDIVKFQKHSDQLGLSYNVLEDVAWFWQVGMIVAKN